GNRRVPLGTGRALRLREPADEGIDRQAGAAALLSPQAGRRSEERRASDLDDRRQGLVFGLRARGGRRYGIRKRRFLLEYDPGPRTWLELRTEDDLFEQGIPRQRRFPQGPYLFSHQRSRAELQADGRE